MNIAVLLSTYNGEKYLEAQLDSLLSQSVRDFSIYIRDDGSSDETLNIIDAFCRRDQRIVLLDSSDNIGCAASFLYLLRHVEADIYMFCDQDDIWLPNKIERVVDYFLVNNSTLPTLYHCDLKVVDQSLNLIHSSFLTYQKMTAKNTNNKNNLYIQNYVVGCTSAINAALANLVLSHIDERQYKMVAMHDWWLAITAKLFGEVYYDDVQTILYRQHQNNVLGAKSPSIIRFMTLGLNGQGLTRVRRFRHKVSRQNELLLKVYDAKLNHVQKNNLKAVVNALGENASIKNILYCFQLGCYMQGLKRNIALIYSIIHDKRCNKL